MQITFFLFYFPQNYLLRAGTIDTGQAYSEPSHALSRHDPTITLSPEIAHKSAIGITS